MLVIKNTSKYIYLLVGAILFLSSCEKEYESIESIDDAKIQAYLQKNSIDAVKDPSGFYYQILNPGTGDALLEKDSVFYTSEVKSLTGTVYYTPAQFTNDATYLGYINPAPYRIGMLAVKRGGKVRVILPSHLAFGKNGKDNIPSNEVIVAEISILPEKTQIENDDKKIQAFIAAKGLTGFTKHPSRVYQSISEVGTGTTINQFSTIKVTFKGRLLTGSQFDGLTDYSSALSDLIPGWRKVLVGVKKGTKMRILIPSDLAYMGRTDNPAIPPNSVLDFDIEIVDVEI